MVQIVADHIVGTAHDFTGCGYGYVEGVDFVGSCTGVTLPFLDLAPSFHRLSLTSHRLFTAFPWHRTVFSPPFLGMALSFSMPAGAMVLNGRTDSPGPSYGSDIIFRRCNFGGAPKGAFVDHMGEVLTSH